MNAIYALHQALLELQREGLENSWARHRRLSQVLGQGLQALGLEYLVEEAHRLPQLNAVKVPEGIDEARLRQQLLADHNLEIGAGLGPLSGKIWRIGLMGYACNEKNISLCLNALEAALSAQGYSRTRAA